MLSPRNQWVLTTSFLSIQGTSRRYFPSPGNNHNMLSVNEETLKNAVVKAINKVLCSKNTFLHTLQDNIATVLHEDNDKSTVVRPNTAARKSLE